MLTCTLDSRHRISWPQGHTYNFRLHTLNSVRIDTDYQIKLLQAIIPNQFKNVFVGINNQVGIKFKNLTTGQIVGPYPFVIDYEASYTIADIASPLEAFIQTKISAIIVGFPGWTGMSSTDWQVAYNTDTGGLVFQIPVNYAMIFSRTTDEGVTTLPTGTPMMFPSARFAQMMGLHDYYEPYGGQYMIGAFTPGGPANYSVFGQACVLSGSRYVKVVLNLPTNNIDSLESATSSTLATVPLLTGLGTLVAYESQANSGDRPLSYTRGSDLQNLTIRLLDEWGNDFVLESNQNILLVLGLYPGASSDYSA